jgi:hypothetical protein
MMNFPSIEHLSETLGLCVCVKYGSDGEKPIMALGFPEDDWGRIVTPFFDSMEHLENYCAQHTEKLLYGLHEGFSNFFSN